MIVKQVFDLSADDKRLLNVLEIKVYDLSQNVQIIAKQLSNNQIKDVVAQTYNIFCQLKPIFQKIGAMFLYDIIKKTQVNSILISSILTDKLDRKLENQKNPQKEVEIQLAQPIIPKQVIQEQFINVNSISAKIPKLGGINLYNQKYRRGLEYQQVDDISNIDEFGIKCHVKQSKKFKQNLMDAVVRQLENKTDVQTDNINDEIQNFIRNYKQNNKISSCISYQKELSEIIDFFKTSQLQAMNYLSKSPKNGNEYTEDYINRINDMEKEIKSKESQQKSNILQKMKGLILRMKEKIVQIEKVYEEKNQKLIQYQKSLKRQTVANGTQTNDGYERKIKQLQAKAKESEEKYVILSQLKKDEFNMEDKMYQINHQIHIKENQIKKLMTIQQEQEEELLYLKKLIRQNKQKFAVPPEVSLKKIKVKTKLFKEKASSRKNLEENGTFKILEGVDELQAQLQKKKEEQNKIQQARLQKKAKRYEKFAHNSSVAFRPSINTNVIQNLQKLPVSELVEQIPPNRQRQNITDGYKKKKSKFSQNSNSRQREESPIQEGGETKETNVKNQSRNIKKQSDEQRQVCFELRNNSNIPTPVSSVGISNHNIQKYNKVSENSIELTPSENNINENSQDQQSERLMGNNLLQDKSKSNIISMNATKKSLVNLQGNKSSTKFMLSKKKQAVSPINKLITFSIDHQYNISLSLGQQILPKNVTSAVQQKVFRTERLSYSEIVQTNSKDTKQIKHGNIAQNNIKTSNILQPTNQGFKNKPINKSIVQSINQKRRQPTSEEDEHASVKSVNGEIAIKKGEPVPKINISKKQKSQQSSNLVKKQKQLSKLCAQSQLPSVLRKNSKKFATCLQKVHENGVDRQSDNNSYQSRMMGDDISEDNMTMANYIADEIQKQNLNLSQFQQIMKVIGDDEQSMNGQNINQGKHVDIYNALSIRPESVNKKVSVVEITGSNVKVNNLRQDQRYNANGNERGRVRKDSSYLNQYIHQKQKASQLFKEFQSLQSMKIQGLIITELSPKGYRFQKTKQQNLQKILLINKQVNKKIIIQGIEYPISRISMDKIRQLHHKNSKCNNRQNAVCQHIQKYLTILKKINESTAKTKQAFKLPIQKIGQVQFQKDQQIKELQKIMPIKSKKEASNKTKEGTSKYRISTEQYEQLKDRILPTINTTNTFYKAKNKIR